MSYAALAQFGLGAIQTGVSASQAAKLPQDKKITVSPELRLAYNMSRRKATEGWDPVEKRMFDQALGRQGSAAKRMFQNAGLAGAGSAAANIMGIDALNQFAAQGAANKRASFGQFANLAGQIDQVGQNEVNRFNIGLEKERDRLGMASKTGSENMFKGLQSQEVSGQNKTAMDIWKEMGQQDETLTAFSDSPYIGGETPSWFSS